MKRFTSVAAIALITAASSFTLAFADDTAPPPATTPAAAKQTFEQMTPEQKQAMKDQAKSTAQDKQAAWQQLSPEDKQAKRDAMRTRMKERAAQFRSTRRR